MLVLENVCCQYFCLQYGLTLFYQLELSQNLTDYHIKPAFNKGSFEALRGWENMPRNVKKGSFSCISLLQDLLSPIRQDWGSDIFLSPFLLAAFLLLALSSFMTC